MYEEPSEVISLAQVVCKPTLLAGVKTPISDVIGKPLVFTAWHIGRSKFKTKTGERKECLTLQYMEDGVQKIVQTSSRVLIQ